MAGCLALPLRFGLPTALLPALLLPQPAFSDTPVGWSTPSPPSTSLSAQDEFSPDYRSESGSSNVVNLRAQLPYDNGRWVLRLKLPIVTSAPSEAITGAGDLALWALSVQNAGTGQWLLGPTIRIPTAKDSLGTNKYSLGPCLGYATERAAWTVGFFGQTYFSVIGPAIYPAVAKTQIAPTFKYELPQGWNIGLSTMQFTYDWVRNQWTDVPIGFRVGKTFTGLLTSWDAYFEAEKNLASAPDTPSWTARLLLRWKGSRAALPTDGDQDE